MATSNEKKMRPPNPLFNMTRYLRKMTMLTHMLVNDSCFRVLGKNNS